MSDDLVEHLRTGIYTCDGVRALRDRAADRIEKLEKYQSIHAHCDKVSLELEAKLVKQLGAAHKRIEQLEAALRHYVCDCIAPDCEVGAHGDAICGIVARKALEGKDE